MLGSTTVNVENRGHVRFLLDGKVKTLSVPVTGVALHAIAGNPASLTSGGKEVPNNAEPFELKEDQEFLSRFDLAKPAQLPPDGVDHKPAPPLVPGPEPHDGSKDPAVTRA
jgi:hypothetical protein